MRVLVEVASIVAGLLAAALIASWAAWAYPRGERDIWLVAGAGMILTILLGAGAVWRAYKIDREKLRQTKRDGDRKDD